MNDTCGRPDSRKSIATLLSSEERSRDATWLEQMLQRAVELEFSTIPPYLCAFWSIMDDDGSTDSDLEVYGRIKGIVREEMSHIGLAANLLNSIGGSPEFNSATVVPKYPGPLPGGVRPCVRLSLQALSMTTVADIFMQIEYPQNGPLEIHSGRRYPTIGAFYQAILRAFECHPKWIVGDRQIEYQNGPIDIFPIARIEDVRRAVSTITEQGEGTSSDPFAPSGDTAHYYRFGEIYHQREIKSDGSGGWNYSGATVLFPAVFPVPEVPSMGYYTPASQEFNRVYTSMLNDLQTAWATGDTTKVESSLDNMKEMKPLARGMMRTPLPEGGGNYCPDFRLYP